MHPDRYAAAVAMKTDLEWRGGPVGCLVMVDELDSYRAIFRLATSERKTGSSSTGHHAIVGQKKSSAFKKSSSWQYPQAFSRRQAADATLDLGRELGMINIAG